MSRFFDNICEMYIGKKREPTVVLILSLITCSIYLLYFLYVSSEDINKVLGYKRIDSIVMLLITIFIPFAGLFWLYTLDKAIAQINQSSGRPVKENFILWLILTLFCGVGYYVASYQIQGMLNEIWDDNKTEKTLLQ